MWQQQQPLGVLHLNELDLEMNECLFYSANAVVILITVSDNISPFLWLPDVFFAVST